MANYPDGTNHHKATNVPTYVGSALAEPNPQHVKLIENALFAMMKEYGELAVSLAFHKFTRHYHVRILSDNEYHTFANTYGGLPGAIKSGAIIPFKK